MGLRSLKYFSYKTWLIPLTYNFIKESFFLKSFQNSFNLAMGFSFKNEFGLQNFSTPSKPCFRLHRMTSFESIKIYLQNIRLLPFEYFKTSLSKPFDLVKVLSYKYRSIASKPFESTLSKPLKVTLRNH